MKLSEKWLREWVNPNLSREALIEKLNMSGLAVESCEPFENNPEDYVLEFELTPNRGDCLSILGIAREISALTDTALNKNRPARPIGEFRNVQAQKISLPTIEIKSPPHCPRYTGRVISNITPNISTPQEIQAKLQRSGIKLIHPIVDVMNYVMLECGQPLHAFDLDKIGKEIFVRQANPDEEIILLDNKKIELDKDILVIADKDHVHAMAGIMGGLDSAVTEKTRAIFIESAFFSPHAIIGRARRFGLHTDASHRFERGVDPELTRKAIERATELLLDIYPNIELSEIIEKISEKNLPQPVEITLRHERVERILGLKLSSPQIQKILQKLSMTVMPGEKSVVIPPSYRFDIAEEIDLIEEIARLYGYENIPAHYSIAAIKSVTPPEKKLSLSDIKKALILQGYQEIITYSFISEKSQQLFDPEKIALKLSNPLSAEYAVMRTNLWSSLLDTVLYNLNRQQDYLRFFETGLRFAADKQEPVLSGVWAGKALPEQWGEKNRPVDFFDMKNTLTQLFALTRSEKAFTWETAHHPVLHPAQTAKIFYQGEDVGWCGALHPQLQSTLDISNPIFLFEIQLNGLSCRELPRFKTFSKFPAIRRDIALLVDKSVEVAAIKNIIEAMASHALVDLCVFDVYQGKNLPQGKKSLAIGLIFQLLERTLLEEEIEIIINKILDALRTEAGAVLRE